MRRTTSFALTALLAAGCSSTPSSVWLHPEKGDTGEEADLKACEQQAEDVFSAAETDALGHGDFGTYGELVDQRRAMVEKCMAERGWAKVKLPEPPEQPAPVEDAPPEATRLGVGAAPEAQAPEVVAPAPVPVAPAQLPADAPAAAEAGRAAVSGTRAPTPPARPPVQAPPARGPTEVGAPTTVAAPSPEPGSGPTQAPAAGQPETPAARRQADLLACRAEAERALAESGGDALAHADFSEFTPTAERRKKRVEKCMAERGWAEADGD